LEKIKCNTSYRKVLVASSKASIEYAARSPFIEESVMFEALLIGAYNGWGYNVSENTSLSSVSAIWRVESSAKAVKISSASVMWSRKFCCFNPLIDLWFFTLKPVHS
jgi:hypothetical protein